MKQWLAFFVAAALSLSACGGQDGMVSSKGEVEPPSPRSQAEFPAEWPDANLSLPIDGIDPPPPESQPPASGSQPPASSSQPPESSSQPPASSSQPPASSSQPPESSSQPPAVSTAVVPDEVRAIWVSYLDLATLAQNQTRSAFSTNIDGAFSTIADYGLNTVFVHVRPFGDAMYPSEIFPWSYVLTKTEGTDPGYDPLDIMVSAAKKYGLRIETWVNPYRVRAIGSTRTLSSDNPAVQALRAGRDTAIEYDGGLFYNPASKTARNLITQGVVELVENYDIDGVHFDDYFYPTTNMSFDASYYAAYRAGGGTLSQAAWRRQNVNLLVRQVYAAVKQADSDVLFGISPQARMDNNYDGQFIDVEVWLSSPGYVDYICPQIYYGFDNDSVPYDSSLGEWNTMAAKSDVDLYVGLAVYKCGVADQWAGSGKSEWIDSADLLSRMVSAARQTRQYAGFVLYRYDSLFRPEAAVSRHIARERDSLARLL